MPEFASTTNVNIEIDDKVKEKEGECHESILHFILSSQNKYKLLEKMILSSSIERVDEIPQQFNGNCVYELPPASTNKSWREWSKNTTAMFG